ncbi:MAG: TIGR04084 family radical SAM/SPASM domain-containing protein [Methanoregulaceae archaeon]|nr:TIGR04084 family radical SAM/SPASM domain-containing protein [Methanoregulaceae archaeon]
MFYHVILTDSCNLCCRYCRGKAFDTLSSGETPVAIDKSLPLDLSYELQDLYSFFSRDPDPIITFYGGEPLMRMDLIRTIMDNTKNVRFMIQTNGLLLDHLGTDYVNRMETILVSVDGPEQLTDTNRGSGTFGRIFKNIQGIVRDGFSGELIARMTVTEQTDIHSAVQYLLSNDQYSFSSIHWQIDADFSGDSSKRNFKTWLTGNYNQGIRDLMTDWVGIMKQEGRVIRLYPFLQTTEDLLYGRSCRLRCGCGYSNYTIMTDGHIGPCPVMIGMTDSYIGHITTANPLNLPTINLTGSCTKCEILGFCGGRCLFADITRPWSPDHKSVICSSVQNLQDGLQEILPVIRDLLHSGRIRMEDFSHTRYNGCEIIP